jgi:anti-anti-sigma factor
MNAGGCASGDGIVPIPCDFTIFSAGRFGALNAITESVGAKQITAGPEPVTGFPQEVIMTIANYTPTAEPAIASPQSADSIQLTELVRGSDRRLLEHLEPLARRQSLNLDLASVERIDAAGISALIALYTASRDAGHRFTVSNATARVARVLALVGLDRILLQHRAVQSSFTGPRFLRPAA